MSLILNDQSRITWNLIENGEVDDQRNLARLDRYLALADDNKKAARFIPDDALVALDMAGFVRGQLASGNTPPLLSAARLAMALAQNYVPLPVQ